MLIVWIIVAIFAIGVFVGIVSLLGLGIHGGTRERRLGFRWRRQPPGDPGRPTRV
jgi:hypothetical protein